MADKLQQVDLKEKEGEKNIAENLNVRQRAVGNNLEVLMLQESLEKDNNTSALGIYPLTVTRKDNPSFPMCNAVGENGQIF